VLEADLKRAAVDSALSWMDKAAGSDGRARARLRLKSQLLTAVTDFKYVAAGVNITGEARRMPDGDRWQSVQLVVDPFGAGADPRALHASIAAAAQGHRFEVKATDAGPLIRGLTKGDASGGLLTATGTIDLAAAKLPLEGQLSVRNFTLKRAPLMARLFELASLRGAMTSLTREGMRFEHVTANLSWQPPLLIVEDAQGSASSLLLLGDGRVDTAARSIDFQGQLIPSYFGLNQGPGKLPLIGGLVSRATGQAIQVIDFKVSGHLDDPKIAVNPLRSLAPGALRDLVRPK
jgi:hypothetical protein